MARTKQTARRSRIVRDIDCDDYDEDQSMDAPDEEEQKEMDARLTEEDKVRREELLNAPMQAELKYLEKRWTKKGRSYITEPKDDDDIIEEQCNWHQKFALCVTHQYDSENKHVVHTSLQINSPALKEILRSVIGNFPGLSFHTATISVDFPPNSLYHYLPELKKELERFEIEDPESDESRHLGILVRFVNEYFKDVIKDSENLLGQGLVSYKHLWTIFKPGCLLYSTRHSQPRAYKLSSYQYTYDNCGGLQLSCEFVDFDGDDFGPRSTCLKVPAYEGAASICDLPVHPLSFHGNEALVREALIKRGRHWESHAGQQFREYKGVAVDGLGFRYNVDSRIMIDAHTFHRLQANEAFQVYPIQGRKRNRAQDDNELELLPTDAGNDFSPLTDEHCLMASPMVRGFAFSEKKFLDFFIDKVSPIEWNTQCFEQLVLPESQKDLVQALVAEHTQRNTGPRGPGFDDIIKGKSCGLILVLHGPPGVGKTLTAECVAEFSKRPLYSVSSGDLDTDSTKLDQRLKRTLDLASTWNAVLLIDEADVFLERRSLHDMERNGLVSIFLRTLEYYSGIMFMTTNRVRTFDDAFKSRIHVPLRYGALPEASRARIWRNFLAAAGEGDNEALTEAAYAELAAAQLNGRQIKNVVRTAKSLASQRKQKLGLAQLKQVMDIQVAFERDMDSAGRDIDVVES